MNDCAFEYKGYVGMAEYDSDAGIFHGEVVNTADVVTFQGVTIEQTKKAFMDSVEDHIAFITTQTGE